MDPESWIKQDMKSYLTQAKCFYPVVFPEKSKILADGIRPLDFELLFGILS